MQYVHLFIFILSTDDDFHVFPAQICMQTMQNTHVYHIRSFRSTETILWFFSNKKLAIFEYIVSTPMCRLLQK